MSTCHNKWRSVWVFCSQNFGSICRCHVVLIENQNILIILQQCLINSMQPTSSTAFNTIAHAITTLYILACVSVSVSTSFISSGFTSACRSI